MFKQQIIEQITAQASNLFKHNPLNDFESNFKAILQSAFEKLDLVSREEFEIQQKVLCDTREKLENLEQVIKKLESK